MNPSITRDPFISSLDWQNKGFLVPVFDKNIFTIDIGENHENCIVLLHGYLSSSYDYYKILPELSKHHRVILLDFIGFGFSDKPENKYLTIIEQTDYVLELWRLLKLRDFTLITHDYGNLITKEILARQYSLNSDIEIKKIFFCNGDVPVDHTNYLDIHKFYRDDASKKMISMLTSFGIYKKIMKEVFYDDTNITDQELAEMWYQLEYNNGRDIINFIYHYVRERKIFWNRWTNALKATTIPIELIWGKEDKITEVCVSNLKEEKIASSNISWIENCGHFPMLEKPKEWLDIVLHE